MLQDLKLLLLAVCAVAVGFTVLAVLPVLLVSGAIGLVVIGVYLVLKADSELPKD